MRNWLKIVFLLEETGSNLFPGWDNKYELIIPTRNCASLEQVVMVDKNLVKLVQIILYNCESSLHGSMSFNDMEQNLHVLSYVWSDMKMENSIMTSMKSNLRALSYLPYKLPVMLTLCQRHGSRCLERKNCYNEFTYVALA